MKFFNMFRRNEEGATAIEYGLIGALIAIAAVVTMQGLGSELTSSFAVSSETMNVANASAPGLT